MLSLPGFVDDDFSCVDDEAPFAKLIRDGFVGCSARLPVMMHADRANASKTVVVSTGNHFPSVTYRVFRAKRW